MRIEKIPFEKISQFSARDIEYQHHPQNFSEFISYMPDLEGIRQATDDRKNFKVDRKLLIDVLQKQYTGVEWHEKQMLHLNKLEEESTFTVTAAHQPSLFTGPAYYIYKILSTIRLAEELSLQIPDRHFVPVFITGGEDHDFEEINHTYLFNKKIVWETHQKGPVGRYSNENIPQLLIELKTILGKGDRVDSIIEKYEFALMNSSNYGQFSQLFLHNLLGHEGLIILNMDDVDLKRSFSSTMKWELLERRSEKLVLESQEKLLDMSHRPQAHPREINLFYFTQEGNRERLVFENNMYSLADSDQQWTEPEIVKHLEEHPENFSPNVILRPLYQSHILPDVAFVGGGGEIAYWMERKTVFEAAGLFMPVLVRRNSVFLIPHHIQKNLDKLDLTFNDFLQDEDLIINAFIQNKELNDNIFEEEKQVIHESWQRLLDYMSAFDATLKAYMEAERTKVLKMVDHGEQKMIRAIKSSEEAKVQQIRNIKGKLFPGNGLQERVDNFFQYYVSAETDLLWELRLLLNPLEKDCFVLFI